MSSEDEGLSFITKYSDVVCIIMAMLFFSGVCFIIWRSIYEYHFQHYVHKKIAYLFHHELGEDWYHHLNMVPKYNALANLAFLVFKLPASAGIYLAICKHWISFAVMFCLLPWAAMIYHQARIIEHLWINNPNISLYTQHIPLSIVLSVFAFHVYYHNGIDHTNEVKASGGDICRYKRLWPKELVIFISWLLPAIYHIATVYAMHTNIRDMSNYVKRKQIICMAIWIICMIWLATLYAYFDREWMISIIWITQFWCIFFLYHQITPTEDNGESDGEISELGHDQGEVSSSKSSISSESSSEELSSTKCSHLSSDQDGTLF